MAAHAGRVLPQNAQIGPLNGFSYPDVQIGGKIFRLAPGVRIYDTFNRIVIPTSLPASGNVFYQLDPGGMLIRMWLPTPEEEAGMSR